MVLKHLKISIAMIALLSLTGCGSSYPTVSGQITINGNPVPGVNVLFLPVSTKENPFPGPFAEGTTNAEGRYSLVTRNGSSGATPGPNIVEFYSVGSMEIEFMRSEATRYLEEAAGNAKHPAFQKGQELDTKANSLEEMIKGEKLEPDARTEFTVPENGTETANFELTELKDSE